MSYSKRERGEYIKSQLMDIALRGIDGKTIDSERFAKVYDLISAIDTAGNPKSSEKLDISARDVAGHPAYNEALLRWRKALEARRQRLESKSI